MIYHLDPNSGGYIESVIGNQYKTKANDGTQYYVNTIGEYVNKSNYITVKTKLSTTNIRLLR